MLNSTMIKPQSSTHHDLYFPESTSLTSDFFELNLYSHDQNQTSDFDLSRSILRSQQTEKSVILRQYYDLCLERILRIRDKLQCLYWLDNCKVYVREQKQKQRLSPKHMTKLFLKVFYMLGKKIRGLEQKFFIKIIKFTQSNDMRTYQTPFKKGIRKLDQCFEMYQLKYVYNHPIESHELLEDGYREIKRVAWCWVNKEKIQGMVGLVKNMCTQTLLDRFYQKMLQYENCRQKLQILKGTLNLVINPIKRSFLAKLKEDFIFFNDGGETLSRLMSSRISKYIGERSQIFCVLENQSKICIKSLQLGIKKNQQELLQLNLSSQRQNLIQNKQIEQQEMIHNDMNDIEKQSSSDLKIEQNQHLKYVDLKNSDCSYKQYKKSSDQKYNDFSGPLTSTISENFDDQNMQFTLNSQITQNYFANLANQIKKLSNKSSRQFSSSQNSDNISQKISKDQKIKSIKQLIPKKLRLKSVSSGITPKKNLQKQKQEREQEQKRQKQLSSSITMVLEQIEEKMNSFSISNGSEISESSSQGQVSFKIKPSPNKFMNKMMLILNKKSNAPQIIQEQALQYSILKPQQSTNQNTKIINPQQSFPDEQIGISQPDFSHFYSFPNISTEHLRRQASKIIQQSYQKSQILSQENKIKTMLKDSQTNSINNSVVGKSVSPSLLGQQQRSQKLLSMKQQPPILQTLRPKIMTEAIKTTKIPIKVNFINNNNINHLKPEQYKIKSPSYVKNNLPNTNNNIKVIQRAKIQTKISSSVNVSPTNTPFHRKQYKIASNTNSMKPTFSSKSSINSNLINLKIENQQKQLTNFNNNSCKNVLSLEAKNLYVIDEYSKCDEKNDEANNQRIFMDCGQEINGQDIVRIEKEEKKEETIQVIKKNQQELIKSSAGSVIALKNKRPIQQMKSPIQKGLKHANSEKNINYNKNIALNNLKNTTHGIQITQVKSPSIKQLKKRQELNKATNQSPQLIKKQHGLVGLASSSLSNQQKLSSNLTKSSSVIMKNELKLGSGLNQVISNKLSTIDTFNSIGSVKSKNQFKDKKKESGIGALSSNIKSVVISSTLSSTKNLNKNKQAKQ